jgi:general L-amino acid transport system permease protein
VAIIGIVLTTILGTLLGVGRFSRNALVRGLCYAYVEFFRNVPVLLQLLMWYLLFTEVLPARRTPGRWARLYLSKGGLSFPIPIWEIGHLWGALGLVAGAMLAWLYRRWSYRHFEATGHRCAACCWCRWPSSRAGRAGLVGRRWPVALQHPRSRATSPSKHGGSLTPEFLSVLLGLTIYTAAFVAEVVRAGISRCPRPGRGGGALGLNQGQTMRW